MCFGLKPIKFKFDDREEDVLILDEENEVSDFYFIQTGKVGIGYYLMTQGLSNAQQYHIAITTDKDRMQQQFNYICDYYVLFNTKSEYIYIAQSKVEAMSLSKQYLYHNIIPKYPAIIQKIKEQSKTRYMNNVRRVIQES